MRPPFNFGVRPVILVLLIRWRNRVFEQPLSLWIVRGRCEQVNLMFKLSGLLYCGMHTLIDEKQLRAVALVHTLCVITVFIPKPSSTPAPHIEIGGNIFWFKNFPWENFLSDYFLNSIVN
jgi:hypothetical protein